MRNCSYPGSQHNVCSSSFFSPARRYVRLTGFVDGDTQVHFDSRLFHRRNHGVTRRCESVSIWYRSARRGRPLYSHVSPMQLLRALLSCAYHGSGIIAVHPRPSWLDQKWSTIHVQAVHGYRGHTWSTECSLPEPCVRPDRVERFASSLLALPPRWRQTLSAV
jgi:hypothetical protein